MSASIPVAQERTTRDVIATALARTSFTLVLLAASIDPIETLKAE